jgi:hypothetical protein
MGGSASVGSGGGHWVCQRCGEPLGPAHPGVIEVVRGDPDSAPRGGVGATSPRGARVELRVHHLGCDPDPGTRGYRIDAGRASNLAEWNAWCEHLRDMPWAGPDTAGRLLRFWHEHRAGERRGGGG